MKFRSIVGKSPAVTFREALLQGMAPDGSLYVPERIPPLPASCLDQLRFHSLHTLGQEVLSLFIDEIPSEDLLQIVRKAWTFPIPLVQIESDLFLLELFHGPTLAFKDVGARFMAQVLSYLLGKEERRITIAVATSGDTGSAVAHGFFGVPHIEVFVLYPSGKISRLQEQQMTTLGGNIHAIEVDGTFDDCQRLVKQALTDEELVRTRNLTTANSINLGRLLPQITYYVWAVAQLQRMIGRTSSDGVVQTPSVVVPSGNFGNLTAALYAGSMGAPIKSFVAATNANDVVPEYLKSGTYTPRPSVQTYSNAMDVGDPSNLARLQALYGFDVGRIQRDIEAMSVSDDETVAEIRQTFERTGRILDPHTAVGVSAARRMLAAGRISSPVIVTATAHPAKFPEVVEKALGKQIPLPSALEQALKLPKQSTPLPADFRAWRGLLMG
ncbi:MAG TPA: threonine synthase [Bacteroidetes bacterium]|nr:threonine synthase [Bacteroidota bacterium]